MPSPVAHALVGLTIVTAIPGHRPVPRLHWLAFGAVAANLPDLDFLAGLALGGVNTYHAGASHSLASSILLAGLVALVLGHVWGDRLRIFGVASLLCGSHVLLDMFGCPSPLRPGLPLFWPLSDAEFLSPWRPLMGIIHGAADEGVPEFLNELFSLHNVQAVVLEIATFLPPLYLVHRYALRRERSDASETREN